MPNNRLVRYVVPYSALTMGQISYNQALDHQTHA